MKLNGYPVIHREPHEPADDMRLETVLVLREEHPYHPFVVATWGPHMETTWHQGDYLATLPEAMAAFERRAKEYRIKQPNRAAALHQEAGA